MDLQYTSVIYPVNYNHEDLTILDIYHAVSDYLKIPDYTVKCRKTKFAYARHLFCYLSREYTTAEWRTIANHIGGRDHTTAIHSKNTLQDLYDTEEAVRDDVSNIKAIINEKRNYAITERRKIA